MIVSQKQKAPGSLFAPFRQLRWRLTLAFTPVTLAALLMALWWSLVSVSLYLARITPQASPMELSTQILYSTLPNLAPWLFLLILPAILVGAVFGFITARWLESRLNRLREVTDAWNEGIVRRDG